MDPTYDMVGRYCRDSNGSSRSKFYDGSETFNECVALCEENEACVGIEYVAEDSEPCELHSDIDADISLARSGECEVGRVCCLEKKPSIIFQRFLKCCLAKTLNQQLHMAEYR